MTDSNSTALRGALARAIKSHVEMKGLNGVQAAKECGIANSRMSTILRGQVEKISSDALVDILGTLGYRMDSVIGATEGHEFTLTLGHEETVDYIAHGGLVILSDGTALSYDGLPNDIEQPITPEVAAALQEEVEATRDHYAEADPDANRVIADE